MSILIPTTVLVPGTATCGGCHAAFAPGETVWANPVATLVICDECYDDGETCDGCDEPGAMCEYDGFVFHNNECWGAAERRYYQSKGLWCEACDCPMVTCDDCGAIGCEANEHLNDDDLCTACAEDAKACVDCGSMPWEMHKAMA